MLAARGLHALRFSFLTGEIRRVELSKEGTKTFGEALYTLRTNRGLSQHQFASIVGLSKSYLSELENQRRPAPPESTVENIARALAIRTAQHELLQALATAERRCISARMSIAASGEVAALIRVIAKIGPNLSEHQLKLIRNQLETNM